MRTQTRRQRHSYTPLLLAGIASILLWTIVYTQRVSAEYIGDCATMLNGTQKALQALGGYAYDGEAVDTETLTRWLQSLGHYCCAYKLLDSENQGCKETADIEWGADSPYLFDQLLDLAYRRLDANEDAAARYNLSADPKWEERQKKLVELWNPDNKVTPQNVLESYIANRPQITPPLIDFNTCTMPENSNSSYDALTLDQRYTVACHMSSCIADKAAKTTSNLIDASRASQTINMCHNIVQTRVNQETDYVRQLQVRVGTRNINNIMQQYTQNYFIDTRRQMLYEATNNLSQNLTFVNRKVQEWTPSCSGK